MLGFSDYRYRSVDSLRFIEHAAGSVTWKNTVSLCDDKFEFRRHGKQEFQSPSHQLQLRLDLHRDVEWQGADADGDARMVADLGPEHLLDQ